MNPTAIPDLLADFHRDGFLVLPGLLPPDQAGELREGVRRAFEVPCDVEAAYGADLCKIWRPRMFEHGAPFEALVDNPAVIDLVEAILGSDCHLIANSALRTGPGDGISTWHADEEVRFPRPEGVPLDDRIPIPCMVLNFNYYLCDVDEELGPTQLVPGSHRSGRQPTSADFGADGMPAYNGRSAVSAIGSAGTAVMWNDQTWHRGATNRSANRIRWVQQAPYGRRCISQRYYPFINYRLPPEILERANPRRKRLLGLHGAGAYG
ncbi:MAG: phytanoyl-CoA dioxygenase family protein [Armatimonadetes bacterium]|nr:phytanoyl-CoA dioxygenase family protein [Armatimonadota bacterium]MDE2207350.1 phytanoyl-CoA dioxygenase family protein [Armatimonadota bacterium]